MVRRRATERSTRPGVRSWFLAPVLCLGAVLVTAPADARDTYLARLPSTAGCSTCHNNIEGGRGCSARPCLNPFGMAFDAAGRAWSSTLAAGDADGDGCTNGEEIGDPGGNGTIVAENYCARSPGLAAGSPTPECARRDEFCCASVERGRGACECGPSQSGTVMCPLDAFLPNDLSTSPAPLLDGIWTPLSTVLATSTEPPSSCGDGTRDVWFQVFPDCPTGNMVIELMDPADVVVFSDDGEPRRELHCARDTTRIELPAQRLRIGVSDVSTTSIRATCEPVSSDASVCANAEPIGDGETIVDIPNGGRGGVTMHPDDRCASDVEHDLWFEYEATCTGRANVTALFGTESEFGSCLDLSETTGVLAVYSSATTCPERDMPSHPVRASRFRLPLRVRAGLHADPRQNGSRMPDRVRRRAHEPRRGVRRRQHKGR